MEQQPPEDLQQETRDLRHSRASSWGAERRRSSRERSPSKGNGRRGSVEGHSPSMSSRRSASPRSGAASPKSVAEEGEEELTRKRSSKGTGPKLNTWDVPEFLPGALPRATPVQRAYFEERSKKVFQNNLVMDEIEAEASRERMQTELAEKLEDDMITLRELFPTIDTVVIQETYLTSDGEMEPTINQLLILSQGTSTGNTPRSQPRGPPSVADDKEYPTLTDREGWQVLSPAIHMTIEETPDPKYKDSLVGKRPV